MSTVNVVSLDTWLGMNLAGNFYTFQQECFLLLQKYKNSEKNHDLANISSDLLSKKWLRQNICLDF